MTPGVTAGTPVDPCGRLWTPVDACGPLRAPEASVDPKAEEGWRGRGQDPGYTT